MPTSHIADKLTREKRHITLSKVVNKFMVLYIRIAVGG
jgi:hypothetical protein